MLECCNKVANALYWWGCEFRLRSRNVFNIVFNARNAGCACTIMHSDLRLLYMRALGVICDLVKFMVFKKVCATANFYVTADLQSVFGFW